MQAKIKEESKKLFTPKFRIVVNGKPVDVSLKDAENNAEKWALTSLAIHYVDFEKVVEEAKKRKPKAKFLKIDMNKVIRGTAFDPSKKPLSLKEKIDLFHSNQAKNIAKLKQRFESSVGTEEKSKKKGRPIKKKLHQHKT